MGRLAWAGLILSLVGAGGAARAADPTGVWVVNGNFGSTARYAMLCAFKLDGAKLSGPCIGAFGPLLSAGGTMDGDRLSISYLTDYQGNDVNMTYAGRLRTDGYYHGDIQTGVMAGAFTAQAIADWPEAKITTLYFNAGLPSGVTWNLGCGLKRSGRSLRGPCAVAAGPPADAVGAVDGAKVTFAHDTLYQGQKQRLDYAGVVQADGTISGTVSNGMVTGSFTAKRR